MKKFFTYPVFVVLFFSFIGIIGFGSLLKQHYTGGERFQSLQNIAVTIADVPSNIKEILLQPPSHLLTARDRQEFKDYKAGFNFKNKKDLDILFLLNYTNPSIINMK